VKPEEKTETVEGQAQPAEVQPAEAEQKPAVVEEEEDKTKTFEEYLKSKKAVAVELPKARQANEGTNNDQWKAFVPLAKKDEESASSSKKEEKETCCQEGCCSCE